MQSAEQALLNDWQRDFPLTPRPFAAIAERLGCDESEVIEGYRRLLDEGKVSRIGAVLRTGAVGARTLAAMAVPPERLEAVAAIVSGYPEVNHNYEREHRVNLWFVVTASNQDHLARVIGEIERRSGLTVLDLPMVESYFLDLGFELSCR